MSETVRNRRSRFEISLLVAALAALVVILTLTVTVAVTQVRLKQTVDQPAEATVPANRPVRAPNRG